MPKLQFWILHFFMKVSLKHPICICLESYIYLFGIIGSVCWPESFLPVTFPDQNNTKNSKPNGPWKVPKISVDILLPGPWIYTLFWLDVLLLESKEGSAHLSPEVHTANPSRHDPICVALAWLAGRSSHALTAQQHETFMRPVKQRPAVLVLGLYKGFFSSVEFCQIDTWFPVFHKFLYLPCCHNMKRNLSALWVLLPPSK